METEPDYEEVDLTTPRNKKEAQEVVQETPKLTPQTASIFKTFKVLVVGEPGVGKSSFIKRYVKNTFSLDRRTTVSLDFIPHIFHWDADTEVSIHFWDIPGQHRMEEQQALFYRDARACLVMYDCVKQFTLTAARKWKENVDKHCMLNGRAYKPPCILIANKIDLACDNSADFDSYGLNLVVREERFRCGFPISNLSNYNIAQVVRKLVEILLDEDKILTGAGLLATEEDETVIDLSLVTECTEKPNKKCTC